MLTDYIAAAMKHAKYEIIDDERPFYGEIPDCRGVWANASTLEDCRRELQEVLEGWLLLGLKKNARLPVIDGISLATRRVSRVA